jgi:FMN phosphatase YigB (HAD superfamily)
LKNKLVIFDFADTIAKLSPSKEELLHKYILSELNIDIPLKHIEEVYHYATNLLFYSSVDIKKLKSKKEFYKKFNSDILSLLGIAHLLDSEKLFYYFNENGQHWILKDGVKELFVNLKEEGCLISLVSNFDKRLNQVLKDLGIDDLLDSKFISQEVGLEKPDIEFFKLSLMKHNIEAADTFFIGDSYFLDFIPSQSLGIFPILLDENNRFPLIPKTNKINNIVNCEKIITEKVFK